MKGHPQPLGLLLLSLSPVLPLSLLVLQLVQVRYLLR